MYYKHFIIEELWMTITLFYYIMGVVTGCLIEVFLLIIMDWFEGG